MDREAAVLREEMTRTREELDGKIALLQARVTELSPQRLTRRYFSNYSLDRALGAVLMLVGLKMAWSRYRWQRHRAALRAELAAHGHWS